MDDVITQIGMLLRHLVNMMSQSSENVLLSVGFGDTLEFVLLLDGVAVRAALGGVDQLVGQAFGDGLDVTE